MSDTLKELKKYNDIADELARFREDVLGQKVQISLGMLGILMEKMTEAINDAMSGLANSAAGTNFGEILKAALSDTVVKVFELYKTPELKQEIKIDLQPMVIFAQGINQRNDAILDAMNKIASFQRKENPELPSMISAVLEMIRQNNEFIKTGLKQTNYSDELKNIQKSIDKRQTEWEAKVTERNGQGQIQKLTIKAK